MESFEDTTIIVLVVAAVVSLAVGIYEDPSKGWIEGAAILFAVMIVAVVTATNNYNKELQFRKLNAVKDDVSVSVIRDGKTISINIKELVRVLLPNPNFLLKSFFLGCGRYCRVKRRRSCSL